ncbi:TonB-dependent receptor plug domain-containing protein [Lysobacter silvisoli]|uniref:TonB-dependent receptor n=1 Tax=Lysobacter silvisoli TaxID=2293254 RepID=A0A371JXV9_9GAMM|nr:TonB-dependent receptor [Lysobacter silvisoli]RDZ26496.1 TonB-dependent receptor [Lysobacter silvisoli]
MNHTPLAAGLARALAGAALFAATGAAFAQAPMTAAAAAPAADARDLDAVVVEGQIVYRNRTDALAPTLSYDLEYFQRFEPLTVGDMLKRVPSVTFVSDVLEYDGARLRGLDPGYTQVLINGKKVPGAGDDRSFFVDRIPAELVERIEIVRSPSANRSGDAVAGALNIVLRDAYEFDGGYLRAGALRFDDGEVKGTVGGVASGDFGGGRLLGGFNVQGRYNPKLKRSDRFEEPDGDFTDAENQTDTRDGTDYSANLSYTREIGSGQLSLSGLYVRTDRTEREHSLEYNDPTRNDRDHLLSDNDQVVDIDQKNLALSGSYRFDMLGGRTTADLGYSRFEDVRTDTEEETGYDDDDTPPAFDEREGTRILSDQKDVERSLSLSHQRRLAGGAKLEFGIDAQSKDRDTLRRTSEVDTDDEGAPLPPYADFERAASRIEERRLDPYLMLSGPGGGAFEWEAGLRYETTDVDVREEDERASNDYAVLLPSAHLRWNLGERDRISLSLARTVRRPSFNYVLPLTLEEEYGDNDFAGNPKLDPETAWGLDLGFERRLGAHGIVGVNLFYRDVKDLIEVVNTGRPSATALDDYEDELEEFLGDHPGATPATPGYPQLDPNSFVYTAANVGDGYVYGIEFDASTPLTALGLPDTGVFANYSWLDSEVEDALGKRRFNNQSRYVYNVGFIHDVREYGWAFGASYRRQGDVRSRALAEEVLTRYGADLEVFVEKRFGESFSIRLTGSNLLDAKKREDFHKFDTLGDQLDRDYDEFERESEQAGPVYQLIARYKF